MGCYFQAILLVTAEMDYSCYHPVRVRSRYTPVMYSCARRKVLLFGYEYTAFINCYYNILCTLLGVRSLSLTSFRNLWKDLLPHIVTAKPMTDLCEVCQRNNVLIYKTANLADKEKLERLQQHMVLYLGTCIIVVFLINYCILTE